MTEVSRASATASPVDSVRSLFDDLKVAEKAVKDIKAQIAAVRVALRGPSRKAKPSAGQVLSRVKAKAPSKRRGLPGKTEPADPLAAAEG